MEKYAKDLEDDDSLDLPETEPVDFWAEKQKELITSVVDYNLSAIYDLIQDNTIDLNPGYQRRLRWDNAKQSRLIESFLMNVPVPPVFLNEDEYGRYSVIDGKQRLNAVFQFLANSLELRDLSVFSDINRQRFNDLPVKLRNIIRTRPTIRAVIILRQSDSDVKYEVFQRLNTGGARLNPQEIRNNAFHGPLNDLVMSLSESREFHSALGIKSKSRSAIYQEMRDAELVLRYFTFKDTWRTFSGGIKRAMDRFMEQNRAAKEPLLTQLERDFRQTLRIVTSIFGDHSFHRWVPEKMDWRKHPLAALYDAQMLACQDFSIEQLAPHRSIILERFRELFFEEKFRRSIDAATNTPSLFKERIATLRVLLGEIAG